MHNNSDLTHHANTSKNPWKGLCWLSVCSLLIVISPVFAASHNQVSETDYLEDIPVVLSPTRLAQPVTEAPAAVTVIDREMIEASGARQIVDLFRLVPGFTVAYFNGYTPSVTYHGFADEYSRRMQVLIDGRSVYLPSIGGVDWASLPITLDDIENIEVIRGPDSASYGANSFLAVISITTRHAVEDQGTTVHVRSGEHRVRDGVVRFGAGSQSLAYHLTLGYRQDDGFDTRYDTHRTQLLNSRVEYQLGMNDSITTQIGLTGGSRQTGDYGDVTDPPRNKGVNSHFEQVHWLHSIDPAQELSLQIYHNYNNTSDDYSSLPIDLSLYGIGMVQLPISRNITTERYSLELQDTLAPRRNLRLVWGGSTRQDQVTAPGFFYTGNTLKTNVSRLYANLEWHIRPALVTNFGALYEYNDLTGAHLTPRLAANFHLDARQTLRAVISTATRMPTLFEDQGNWKLTYTPDPNHPNIQLADLRILGNDTLKSERILSRELGYLFYWPERGTSLDVKLYDDELRDMIRSDYVCENIDLQCLNAHSGIDNYDNNYQLFMNTDNASVRGLELQLDQQLGAVSRIIFGYARTLIGGDAANHPNAHSAPVNNLHALLIRRFPGDITASMAYYQVGNMEYLGSGNHTDVQKRLDLRLARTFRHDADKFKIALVVQNLLDPYQDFIYKPGTPSNLFDTRAFVELVWAMP